MKSKKVMMVTGEASGDLHGAHLMETIHRVDPNIQFFGMGGEALKRAGMNLLYHNQSLSVVGITEVLLKLGSIRNALRGLKRSLEIERPDLVILIDFPDFNLRLAKFVHERGIPVFYYISPQVWAWRPGRVKLIARRVKKMVVFFAFEVPIYEAAGVDVEWVGHPLLDVVKPALPKEEAVKQLGLDPGKPILGLLPGSREQELERLLPVLLDAAHLLQQESPGLQFVIPLAPGLTKTSVSRWMENAWVPVKLVEGQTYDVMNLSDLLIMASGTATLEAAILGKPMIIIYKVSSLSYWIGRLLVHVKHIGLVNLVAGKGIVPELIQKDASPERIAREALRILKNPTLRQEMTESMIEVRKNLGDPGAVQRAARIVLRMLENKKELGVEGSRVQGV
jgi:lipid-A-disaccharide synthase